MILKSTKFGGNRTKDVEVGLDGWTDRFLYTPPPQTMFAGGIMMCRYVIFHIVISKHANFKEFPFKM
jgi:hypothetical protein